MTDKAPFSSMFEPLKKPVPIKMWRPGAFDVVWSVGLVCLIDHRGKNVLRALPGVAVEWAIMASFSLLVLWALISYVNHRRLQNWRRSVRPYANPGQFRY